MPIKLLKKIATDIAGISADRLVDLLYNKKNVNEFLIAKKLNLTINQTRNILYKLADEGLVSFIRKKDKKKGGWYIYFWTLDDEKSLTKYKEKLQAQRNHFQDQLLNRQTKQFYHCVNCNIEYNEEAALMHNYTCPECGEVLSLRSPVELIAHINEEMKKIDEINAQIDVHLQEISKRQGVVRARRDKAEIKKKEEERLKRKKEREKLKKALEKNAPKSKKKTGAKPSVKKSVKKPTKKRK